MATETTRKDYGMTDLGAVCVIGKQSYDDSGEKLVTTYEVRHGVRTVVTGVSQKAAEAVAKALGSSTPAEEPAPPAPEPEPVPEPASMPRIARRS